MTQPVLALHGGAGASRKCDYEREVEHMRSIVTKAKASLLAGTTAIDVAVDAVAAMEDSGLYVAGRGGSPALNGAYELDACVMDGTNRRVGAVAALQGFKNPIRVARIIMETTPHILLAGEGAAQFAEMNGADPIPASDMWFTNACREESNHTPGMLPHGTVGCVVRDEAGKLAAATSTAGLFGKLPGRVSDTPVVGAGIWADEHVAISCTGLGEFFISRCAAARIGFAVAAGGAVSDAAVDLVTQIEAAGGEGGIIAIDRDGNIAMPYRSEGMKRAVLLADGSIHVHVFEEPA